ncbi:MAG: beta-glucosidase [Chloroflexi bacterium]|nr:beta-glucosidase [Chloroflexota bacterium]
MSNEQFLQFPSNFAWGAATSSYQIEGAWDKDGKGVSIWDTFCRQPGKIEDGSTGDVAADHYHRWEEDIGIMVDMGLNAYRFSISWPRILPAGKGQINTPGLDFYDRLVDGLLANGIEPYATLYHWDLPQALQDQGGWTNRDTARYFADYAHVVAERLADRVTYWTTHNEPFVTAMAGHVGGEHAPGTQDLATGLLVAHHVLLSHGYAVEALRDTGGRPIKVGITLDFYPAYPASDSEDDHQAAKRFDATRNRWLADPVFLGRYPEEMTELFGPLFPQVQPGDLERIAAPIDFLGVNYYSRSMVRHDPKSPNLQIEWVKPEDSEYTEMGWEIYPPGLHKLLTRLWADYQPAEIFVTENGAAMPDTLDAKGRVRDEGRTHYLRDHLAQVHRAIGDGVPMRGYFAWSFMDNFEWSRGYKMRFGLVYVDYETLERTVKDSGQWYAEAIRENGIRHER